MRRAEAAYLNKLGTN